MRKSGGGREFEPVLLLLSLRLLLRFLISLLLSRQGGLALQGLVGGLMANGRLSLLGGTTRIA